MSRNNLLNIFFNGSVRFFFSLSNSILIKKVKKSFIFLFVLKIFVYLQKILNYKKIVTKYKIKIKDSVKKPIQKW